MSQLETYIITLVQEEGVDIEHIEMLMKMTRTIGHSNSKRAFYNAKRELEKEEK